MLVIGDELFLKAQQSKLVMNRKLLPLPKVDTAKKSQQSLHGGWSKCSHKHSYNAKSVVGIMIGKEAKNCSYCSVCNKAAGGTPSQH